MTTIQSDLAIPANHDRRTELAGSPLNRYRRLLEIREIEDAIAELFAEGQVPGTTHTCQGQEAIPVALAAVTNSDDRISCTYRGHGYALAAGIRPEAVISEVLGRAGGTMRGLGGSMHLSSRAFGLLPTNAIVGAGLPIAVGVAFAARYRGSDMVSIAVCGDGATNIGAFHEALNLASVWSLPVLFVIENNLYGEYSSIGVTTPIEDLHTRAAAYGIQSAAVDGQHVEQLVEQLNAVVGQIRRTGMPQVIEAKTYRYLGHSRSDSGAYRPPGELESWKKRDPLVLARERLITGGIRDEVLAGIEAEVHTAIADVVGKALNEVEPSMDMMFEHVWATEQA